MRTVLRSILSAKRAYATLPFFEFLRDESITPRDRLGFVPCMAPFIMDFGDLNKYVMRDESSAHPHQLLVNRHTHEDDHHWPWYLEDLTRLGHDHRRSTSESSCVTSATSTLRSSRDTRRTVTTTERQSATEAA